MTEKQRKELIRAQQGEVDAVPMYHALARVVKSERERETFRQLAQEEGRHVAVFYTYTHEVLKPSLLKARVLPILYKVIGPKILFSIIAQFEYHAARNYEHLIPQFPEVASVRDDETRHGDILTSLLSRN